MAADDPHDELRIHREELLDLLDGIDGIDALWAFQRRLVDEIIAAEPIAHADRKSPERQHLKLLRLFGDALAWLLLHPYAIRQLAKNAGPPPALYNQTGFGATRSIAEQICAGGEPALVADITNCVRISDVIACGDRERPRLIESGGHPRFADRGRKGRQKRRAKAIEDLLNDGEAVLLGDPCETVTVEVAAERHRPATSHAAVCTAIDAALDHGQGAAAAGPGDVVIAIRSDQDISFPSSAENCLIKWDA